MLKKLLTIALLPLLAFGQNTVMTGNHRHVAGGSSCPVTAGAATVWAGYNPANLCVVGMLVPCTNGAAVTNGKDLADSNQITQDNSGEGPTYTTGLLNGLPGFVFSQSGGPIPGQFMRMDTPLTMSGQLTLYAFLEPTSNCSQSSSLFNGCTIFGGEFAGALQWAIGGGSSSPMTQFANSQYTTGLGRGTNALSTSDYSCVIFTYDFSSGAGAFYQCGGGTYTADGTFTQTASFATNTNDIGAGEDSVFPAITGYFDGPIMEAGYFTSISTGNLNAVASRYACAYNR